MASARKIGVIGAGAWGTALANTASRAGNQAVLFERDSQLAASIEKKRVNELFLPGVPLEKSVSVTASPGEIAACDIVLLVVPTQSCREAMRTFASVLKDRTPVVVCAKGIEQGTRKFVTQVVADAAPHCTPAILSGPSFASDVGRGLPTAVTLAAEDEDLATSLSESLRSPAFRVYHTSDVRGVEVGGAAKNVYAIASGIAVGRKLGASAHAALTTRGFGEMARLGRCLDARPETLMGLSGLGDLILTASSPQSRNYTFGFAVGEGKPVYQASGGKLAEGSFTASVLVELARANGLELPIAEAVDDILQERADVGDAIAKLLARPVGSEI